MVDVNERTFKEWLPEMEKSAKAASFVAFDLEFLGLPTAGDPNAVCLFDSPAERYKKMCDSVRRFPPCQLGLAFFTEKDNVYEVEVYCICLFKRISKKVFSFSLSAMSFLADHNFDFNKFVAEGITYSNRTELAELKKEITNGDIDYDLFTAGLDQRIQMLKMRLLLEAKDTVENDDSPRRGRSPQEGQIRLSRPLLLELCQKECDAEGDTEDINLGELSDVSFWDRPPTPIEVAAIIYALSEEHPNLEFQVDQSRSLLYVAERPLIFRNSTNPRKSGATLRSFMSELWGVSQLFHCLGDKKPPMVGHNSLLDLMYIYYCFEAELPDTYEEWKRAVHTLFPVVVDTRILATFVRDKLSAHGVGDFSLQTLGNYFDSPSCGEILPFDTPTINGGPHSRNIFDGNEHYHNAAFDALITGEVFIKLAHLYAYSRCEKSILMDSSWPLRKLLVVLRRQVSNRIPIPLIDANFCYLAGDDPQGQRPDTIEVRKRRRLEGIREWTEAQFIIETVGKVMDRMLGPPEVTQAECETMRDELGRVLGSFRVDVRKHPQMDVIQIATNTPNTYARVCSFFTSHDDFLLLDEIGDDIKKSFEERLLAARKAKDGIQSSTKRSRSTVVKRKGFKVAGVVAVLLIVGIVLKRVRR